jgi:two-component system response regulator
MTPTLDLVLIEDDSADAELTLLSLASEGAYRTRHFPDGEEAVDFLLCRGAYRDRFPGSLPRAVFLDIKLPRTSGLEILKTLRAEERTKLLPVVMLTSSRIESDVRSAYRLGANGFVQKPVDFEAFRRAVRGMAHFWLDLNEAPPRPSSTSS